MKWKYIYFPPLEEYWVQCINLFLCGIEHQLLPILSPYSGTKLQFPCPVITICTLHQPDNESLLQFSFAFWRKRKNKADFAKINERNLIQMQRDTIWLMFFRSELPFRFLHVTDIRIWPALPCARVCKYEQRRFNVILTYEGGICYQKYNKWYRFHSNGIPPPPLIGQRDDLFIIGVLPICRHCWRRKEILIVVRQVSQGVILLRLASKHSVYVS